MFPVTKPLHPHRETEGAPSSPCRGESVTLTPVLLLSSCFTASPSYSPFRRVMFALAIVPAGVQGILLLFFPNSPRFLVMRGKPDKVCVVCVWCVCVCVCVCVHVWSMFVGGWGYGFVCLLLWVCLYKSVCGERVYVYAVYVRITVSACMSVCAHRMCVRVYSSCAARVSHLCMCDRHLHSCDRHVTLM